MKVLRKEKSRTAKDSLNKVPPVDRFLVLKDLIKRTHIQYKNN